MNLLDIYLIVSVIMLAAFGGLFKGPTPLWSFLGKVVINLTAVVGAAELAVRLGWLG